MNESKEYYFNEGCHILELLNDPADQQVSIARARVEPGVTTKWHRLRGTTERYVLLQGRGMVSIDRGEPRHVGPGDVVLIPPMAEQRIANTGDGDLVFLAICTPRFEQANYVAE
jgi:mannose-6-phosphate isomerase-like protein (cupin superfamily)